MKKFFLYSCLLLFPLLAKAQASSEIGNIKSPNVASLGIYGEIPVSLYTGLPQIEIPLYTVETQDITVPISLSYHAAGVRPDQHPGWVGVGWTLNAGGVISRNIKKMPDCLSGHPGSWYKIGYYFNSDPLNSSIALTSQNWNTDTFMKSLHGENIEEMELNPYFHDYEPDEFSFSLPNLSGSFYLSPTGEWLVRCDKTVKVEVEGDLVSVGDTFPFARKVAPEFNDHITFFGFTLTTDDGTKYTFGMDKNAIELSTDFFNEPQSAWFVDSWYLTKITSPNGNTVNFIYEKDSGNYINQLYNSSCYL